MTVSMFVLAYIIGYTITEVGKYFLLSLLSTWRLKRALKQLENLAKDLEKTYPSLSFEKEEFEWKKKYKQ